MGGARKRFGTRTMLLLLALLLVTAISTALFAALTDSSNWTVADWANLVISLLLGVYFFALSQHVNQNAQRRAEAVANAELITSTGLLAMSSARSLAGSESAALRVAADARAALQHYPDAKLETQRALVQSVIGAYNDLAFSTFLHSDNLSRSVWARLSEGTSLVVAEADQLALAPACRSKKPSLQSVAAHVGFIEQLGIALRKNDGPDLAVQGHRPLSAVWDDPKFPASPRLQESRSPKDETIYRLDRLEMLYQTELTVMHDWGILRRNAERISCEVELVDPAATGDWLAPWYVGARTDGELGPVNIMAGDLDERARYDKLQVNDSTSRWPVALEHGELPQGMRTTGITNLCHVLDTQPSPTICVLAYELCAGGPAGKTKRLVLDGNHRLAAARRLSLDLSAQLGEPRLGRRFRILTFLIRERQPVDDLSTAGVRTSPGEWRGFTPDIGLLRGTWRPDDARA